MLLCIEGHTVSLHLDIAQVKARCTRESLVTNVSLVNLTVARVWWLFCSFCENRDENTVDTGQEPTRLQ